MEAREKEFPWDYAAVFCVPLKDRSCLGISLPDVWRWRKLTLRHFSKMSAYRLTIRRRRYRRDMLVSSGSVRGEYEERILISLQPAQTAHFIPLVSNKRCERMHCDRRRWPQQYRNTFCIYGAYRLYKDQWLHGDRIEETDRGTVLRGRWFLSQRHAKGLRNSSSSTSGTVI